MLVIRGLVGCKRRTQFRQIRKRRTRNRRTRNRRTRNRRIRKRRTRNRRIRNRRIRNRQNAKTPKRHIISIIHQFSWLIKKFFCLILFEPSQALNQGMKFAKACSVLEKNVVFSICTAFIFNSCNRKWYSSVDLDNVFKFRVHDHVSSFSESATELQFQSYLVEANWNVHLSAKSGVKSNAHRAYPLPGMWSRSRRLALETYRRSRLGLVSGM